MGFDLYGISPKQNEIKPEILSKFQNKDGFVQWDKMSQNDRDIYFEVSNKHKEQNPGLYFRNTVWEWRPLWQYVTVSCDDILTEKDMEEGEHNSGHVISKTKANRIASRLKRADKKGEIMKYELKYKEYLASLPKEKCGICKGKGMRNDVLGREARDKNSAYTCNGCDGKGVKDNFGTHYPFESEQVIRFAEFCEQSGGFEIC